MDIGDATDEIFHLNSNNELDLVRLKPLYDKVKTASSNFIYYLQMGNWSEDHKLSVDLREKANTGTPKYLIMPSITGDSNTIK